MRNPWTLGYGILLSTLLITTGWAWPAWGQVATQKERTDQASEAPTKIERPFVWVIEGKTPQYLLGTIHVPDERVLSLHPVIDRVLTESDSLYVELTPKDQVAQIQVLTLPPGKKIAEVLDPGTLARIDRQLADINEGYSHKVLPAFRIWAWPLILPSFMAQQRAPGSPVMDAKLIQLCQSRQVPVNSLEDPKTQLSGFAKLDDDEQLLFLKATLDDMEDEDTSQQEGLDQLINIYLRGDGQALQKFFLDEFADESLPKQLTDKIIAAVLETRNKVMAATIKSAMKSEPDQIHVFAAGTAHFVIGPSVIDLLQRDGYQIRRIEE